MKAVHRYKQFNLYSAPNIQRYQKQIEQIRAEKGANLKREDFNVFDALHIGDHQPLLSVVNKLGLTQNSKILEFCSGLGGTSRHVAEVTGSQVNAVDLIEPFTDIHNYINDLLKIKNIKTIQGDCISLDYKELELEGNVDFFYSISSFYHIIDKQGVFKKIQSLLKPGATLYLEDFLVKNQKPRSEETENLFQRYGFMSQLTEEEYRELIQSHGMTVTNFERVGHLWSMFVIDRAETYLKNKEQHIKNFGQEYWDSWCTSVITVPTSLFTDYKTTKEDIERQFPLVTKYFGKTVIEDMVNREDVIDGAYITAVRNK